MNHQKAFERLQKDLLLEPKFQYTSLLPYFVAMSEADQTGPYHREGDVLTHTLMVVNALDEVLYDEEGGANYEHNVRHKTLLFAAWFHDIGKPSTKEWSEKKGRNTFNGHEERSATIWRELYLQAEVDPGFGESVLELIRNHQAPTHYSKPDVRPETYQRLAERTNVQDLFLLELADMKGREADDKADLIERVQLFKKRAGELKLLDRDRFEGFYPHVLKDLPYIIRNKKCLLLPIATPGCGKTFLRNELLKYHSNLTVVSPDEIRGELYGDNWHENYEKVDNQKVFGIANHRVQQCMQENQPLIFFDAQNASIKDRKIRVEQAEKYNYAIVCFWFRTKLNTILRQNQERVRKTPEEYIHRAFGHLQFPIRIETNYVVYLDVR
jgi:putative nucleotidyltransferase with HDIG domain